MSKSRQRGSGLFEARPGCIAVLAWEYAHGHRITRHSHRSHQLVFAQTGVMTLHADSGTFIVPPSRAVWVPGGLPHAIDIAGAVSMRTLYLAPTLWSRAPRSCRVLEVTPLLHALIMLAISQRGFDRRRARDGRLIGVLLDQLTQGSPLSLHIATPADPRAARVARRVQTDPGGRQPLRALAHGTGASARTIERLFRAELGISFGRWRKQLKLVHGMQRLAAGDKVTSAALDAGYASVSAFISAFRRAFGVTPGQYFRVQEG